MANISDIVDLAQSLDNQNVLAVPERCAAVRNRHASCNLCQQVCPGHCIEIGGNQLKVRASGCTGCGACTTICPAEALISLNPLDTEFATEIASTTNATGGTAVVACARIASRNEGDPDLFVTVPCLTRVEESLLLQLAAHGIENILLVDGDCSTCKFRDYDWLTQLVVDTANELIEAHGSDIRVQRVSELPDVVRTVDQSKSFGAARREFLEGTGAAVKSTARTATEKAVNAVLHTSKKEPTLKERLQMSSGTVMPTFEARRHSDILDALYELGESTVDEYDTRLFGNVTIDAEKCDGCCLCATFCLTGALVKGDPDEKGNNATFLEFSAADCIQCGLCMDACFKKCIELDTVVPTEQLFDFEPRILKLGARPQKKGFLRK